MSKFKLALCQTRCIADKAKNIEFISEALHTAGKNGAKLSILGESCNSPYNQKWMWQFAEDFNDSPTLAAISKACKQHEMFAMGTVPRKQNGKFYDTAFVINPKGDLQAKMDKIHLFDINIPGKVFNKESDTFEFGNEICVVDIGYCKVGLSVCFDMRFPQLSILMAERGAKLLVFPACFSRVTGPHHWELLLRARAVDNLAYVVGASTATAFEDPTIYQAWAHSIAIDPFGKILTILQEKPDIGYVQIDINEVDQKRQHLPLMKQRRRDLYKLEWIK